MSNSKNFSSVEYLNQAEQLYAAIAKWLSNINVKGILMHQDELHRGANSVIRFNIEKEVSTISVFAYDSIVKISSNGNIEKVSNSGKNSICLASLVAEKWSLMRVKIAHSVKTARERLDEDCKNLDLTNIYLILNEKHLWQ